VNSCQRGAEAVKLEGPMSSTTVASALQDEVSAETMRFLHQLSADLSGPALELPSYPEAALRVQRVLSDVGASTERVVRVVGSEAVLASRVLAMANSAAMNRGGNSVTDLRAAVQRLGFDTLRTAAISFAVAQLRKAAEYRSLEKPMTQLWQQSIGIAAMSFVLSRQLKRFAPDMAMLAGLVSGVGKLYILTRSAQFPALFSDQKSYHEIVKQWHPQVGRSILENWDMAEEVIEAVGEIEEAAMDDRHRVTLADLLSVAQLLTDLKEAPDMLAAQLPDHRGAQRLGLTAEGSVALLAESATEVTALREALGR
jgi:HD-like signal output (HDOD) protein